MESILARALEYTLKYWLKSFNRDQFKLQGRTAQLSNLDINGEALHASLGLPPALNVTTARVGKLEIILPSLSNVQIEPIVVQIDRLDIVLEENTDADASGVHNSSMSSTGATKANGYGYADKIADGMTIQVGTVNLLLETHGGTRSRGGAVWASPMASITMRNLLLYTTNEHWQVVNLKEARDFSNDKKFIYVFRKLEWENLSIDLLPHPDMFLDANFANTKEGYNMKDKHGAKRVFFGGERFVDGISGEAFITIQRTTLNSPAGLEVQLHITEAVCPALSEPGLRALLRFFTGFNICINRGDVNPNTQQLAEAAGRSLVSVMVDHIFICIKDSEFQLELLMQSLFFSRASISDGERVQCLTRVLIGGFFLRDTFSRPTCTLVQPSMQDDSANSSPVPDFGKNFCPPIYPLSDEMWKQNFSSTMISLHLLQLLPTPKPPSFASKTVVHCQPLMIHLQEESCLRIASFLADGITVDGGSVLPDFSINSLVFKLNGLDVTVPLAAGQPEFQSRSLDLPSECSFGGARLHIRDLILSQSPSLKMNLLNLEKDPVCFCLWKNQPIDASQKKLTVGASSISLFLETNSSTRGGDPHMNQGLWRCIEMEGISFELAMVTADGSPLTIIPPPEGVVRVGTSCQKYISNTSVEQLFFVLSLHTYFGRVSERLTLLGKNCNVPEAGCKSIGGNSMIKAPGDTSVTLSVGELQLRFLESSSADDQGVPLVCFKGDDLSIKVGHRTLGGAMAISSTLRWERIEVHCADTLNNFRLENRSDAVGSTERHGLRAVLWIQDSRASQLKHNSTTRPFLNVSVVHVIPYSAQDMECHSLNVSACVAGVRLGGGMNYAESLLHRFGILGPDGGPGENLTRGLKHLADGPLSKLFKASPHVMDGSRQSGSIDEWNNSNPLNLSAPDDIDISVELKDWLFALEGAREMSNGFNSPEYRCSYREERSWHATFGSLQVKAKSSSNHATARKFNSSGKERKYPIELINIGMENLQILKPVASQDLSADHKIEEQAVYRRGGVNVAADIVTSEYEFADATGWVFENLKFSVDEPVEAVVKRDELHHIYLLLNSEVESAGRIAAGFLRILKLEESLGPAAISQLSNLGTGSLDRIFTPEKMGRGTTILGPSSASPRSLDIKSIVVSLEETILDSKMKCAVIATDLSSTESSVKSLDNIKQLSEKLETAQRLINQLKTLT